MKYGFEGNAMPTIYIPSFDSGKRTIMEIFPRWNCFRDRSNAHAIFIDGNHFHDGQIFKSPEAVSRYWQKMPVPDSERFTVSELVEAWDACKKV